MSTTTTTTSGLPSTVSPSESTQAITVVTPPVSQAMQVNVETLGAWAAALLAIAAAIALIYKLVTKDVGRDILDVKKDLDTHKADTSHKINNMRTEIQALDVKYDHVNEDVIVLKADVKSVKESADRLEQGQEKMSDLLNAHFDALSMSIREIRDVRIRPPLSRKKD